MGFLQFGETCDWYFPGVDVRSYSSEVSTRDMASKRYKHLGLNLPVPVLCEVYFPTHELIPAEPK